MSKETELRTFSQLAKQGHLAWASLPKLVRSSAALDVLGTNLVFAHTYGRLGRTTFSGLNEYLRLKKPFPHSNLHTPDQLKYWWKRQSKPLKKGAVIAKRLGKNDDPDVQKVLTLLEQTNQFLEQQAIFHI